MRQFAQSFQSAMMLDVTAPEGEEAGGAAEQQTTTPAEEFAVGDRVYRLKSGSHHQGVVVKLVAGTDRAFISWVGEGESAQQPKVSQRAVALSTLRKVTEDDNDRPAKRQKKQQVHPKIGDRGGGTYYSGGLSWAANRNFDLDPAVKRFLVEEAMCEVHKFQVEDEDQVGYWLVFSLSATCSQLWDIPSPG